MSTGCSERRARRDRPLNLDERKRLRFRDEYLDEFGMVGQRKCITKSSSSFGLPSAGSCLLAYRRLTLSTDFEVLRLSELSQFTFYSAPIPFLS